MSINGHGPGHLPPDKQHANNIRTLKHVFHTISVEVIESVYENCSSGAADVQDSVRHAVSQLYQTLHPHKVCMC
jgi:hypothetical protein